VFVVDNNVGAKAADLQPPTCSRRPAAADLQLPTCSCRPAAFGVDHAQTIEFRKSKFKDNRHSNFKYNRQHGTRPP
jgi:hypothetical protein